jgi:hypothetical protein
MSESIATIATDTLGAGFVSKTTIKLNYRERKPYVKVRDVANRVASTLRGPASTKDILRGMQREQGDRKPMLHAVVIEHVAVLRKSPVRILRYCGYTGYEVHGYDHSSRS